MSKRVANNAEVEELFIAIDGTKSAEKAYWEAESPGSLDRLYSLDELSQIMDRISRRSDYDDYLQLRGEKGRAEYRLLEIYIGSMNPEINQKIEPIIVERLARMKKDCSLNVLQDAAPTAFSDITEKLRVNQIHNLLFLLSRADPTSKTRVYHYNFPDYFDPWANAMRRSASSNAIGAKLYHTGELSIEGVAVLTYLDRTLGKSNAERQFNGEPGISFKAERYIDVAAIKAGAPSAPDRPFSKKRGLRRDPGYY